MNCHYALFICGFTYCFFLHYLQRDWCVTYNWTQASCKVQTLQLDFAGNSSSTRERDNYPVDKELWSRASPEILLCSASVSLCGALGDVQQGFPDLGRNEFAAAQWWISSGIYQSSGSFTASAKKVALRWLYSLDLSGQRKKHQCPPLVGQAVKQEGAGREKPVTLSGLQVGVWGRGACCTSEHHLKRIAVTGL